MVLQTVPGLSGEKVLKPGDVLLKAGDKEVKVAQDLLTRSKAKKPGTDLDYVCQKKVEQKATLTLGALPQEGRNGARAGIGVVPADMQSVKADQEDQQVTIKAGDIGGPSAGLMFSLEILQSTRARGYHKGLSHCWDGND